MKLGIEIPLRLVVGKVRVVRVEHLLVDQQHNPQGQAPSATSS
jgi:hypothetical protein